MFCQRAPGAGQEPRAPAAAGAAAPGLGRSPALARALPLAMPPRSQPEPSGVCPLFGICRAAAGRAGLCSAPVSAVASSVGRRGLPARAPCAPGSPQQRFGCRSSRGGGAAAAGRALWLLWDRRVWDFLAGRSVLCTSIRQEGLLPPAQSPHSPHCQSVVAGHQLDDNAERQHRDGCRHRQPTLDDQRLGDRGGGRRGRSRCGFLGLQPIRRSLQAGDTRERDAVVRLHSRCEENGAVTEGFCGG